MTRTSLKDKGALFVAQPPTPKSGKSSRPASGAASKMGATQISGSRQPADRSTTKTVTEPTEGSTEQPLTRPVGRPVGGTVSPEVAARSAKMLVWLQLVAALLLLYFSVQGFASGGVYFPFGFGLMALYFFYGYVRNGLKVDFGGLTTPLNLVLMLGALVCLVLGLQNEGK